MPLLEIKGLSKSFGGIRAVDECSFSVEKGAIVSLIGPNGAGKTTVFNLVTGLLPLDAGSIFFDGKKVNDLQPHQITRLGISRTFQITRDLQEMTVLENMVVQSQVKGFWDMFGTSMFKEEENRAMDLLSFVGIDHLAHEKSKNLSYGQKKLLEFASVLMSDPLLIMLDEPAGGVNPTLLESLIDRILQLNQKGITFLIVEHNMDLVMKISNPVICMAYGTVLAQGSPKEIQDDPPCSGSLSRRMKMGTLVVENIVAGYGSGPNILKRSVAERWRRGKRTALLAQMVRENPRWSRSLLVCSSPEKAGSFTRAKLSMD